MTATPSPVPAWPRYQLTAQPDDTVTISGPAAQPGPYGSRPEALAAVAALAARLRPPRPVFADAVDADGTVWPLLIEPAGTVHEAGTAQRAKPSKKRKRPAKEAAAPERSPSAPFVVPLVQGDDATVQVRAEASPDSDEHTVRVRRAPRAVPPPDEPTARVRRRGPAPTEQHERPAEVAVGTAPLPQPPTPLPSQSSSRAHANPSPAAADPAPIPSFLRVRALEQSGRIGEAVQMAAALDEAATRAHGPSHDTALQAREVLAHLTSAQGDLPSAVALYRDVAERWALKGSPQAADDAAGRAHALWLRIQDPGQAVATGEAVVRMRAAIPGPGGAAYRKAVAHLSRKQAEAATG